MPPKAGGWRGTAAAVPKIDRTNDEASAYYGRLGRNTAFSPSNIGRKAGSKGLYQTIGNGPGIFVICAGLSQFVKLVTGRKKARMHFCNPG